MRYQVKAVIFDILEECRDLKEKLKEAEILVCETFFGLSVRETLCREIKEYAVVGEECLFLTNNEEHAKVAAELGMAVAGCMEGHFTVPKAPILLESPGEVSVGYLDRVYCHAKQLPAYIMETERTYLRELTKEDMDALYSILTDEEVSRYLPAKTGSREEEFEKLISYVSCVYSFFEYGYWGVFLKDNDRLIGRAGFKEGSYPPEAGYVIERSLWGQGYGTELLRGLILYAKDEIFAEKVLAKIDARNTASVHVAMKCGFSYEMQNDIYVKRV